MRPIGFVTLLWLSLLNLLRGISIEKSSKLHDPNSMIPNIVHMIFLDKRPLQRFAFLGILTVFNKVNPITLFIHCTHAPHGEFWIMIQEMHEIAKRIVIVNVNQPISIFSHTPASNDFAHQSDIVRLNILMNFGGIYIDSDMIVLRSFEDLLNSTFTIGLQTYTNFCNGFIISHRNSRFLRVWYDSYRNVDFSCWDCQSSQYPSKLWLNMTNEVTALNVESFYDPSFSRQDIHELFQENKFKPARIRSPYSGKYGQHLWHSIPIATKYLRLHRFDHVCNSTSIYNEMLRYALHGSEWLIKTCPWL